MHISSFEVNNYKSFLSSGRMQLEPGFNVIVGQNNVGKTALVEALSLRFQGNPHRSRKTIPVVDGAPENPQSTVKIVIEMSAAELGEIVRHKQIPDSMYVPAPPNHGASNAASLVQDLLDSGPSISATYIAIEGQGLTLARADLVGYEPYENEGGAIQFVVDPSTWTLQYDPSTYGSSSDNSTYLHYALASYLSTRLYLFNAVRFPTDENPIGMGVELAPDASNLVQVLDLLHRNTSRWQRFFDQVKLVLPQIEAVSFIPSPTGGGQVRARLWNLDQSSERMDLTIPLSESGTGVAQVLAILYVVFTSNLPRIIIIDEPQSFLHPGAIRKLFEILRSYPQHQYIITTHSPTAVTAADPNTLFLVRKVEEESSVETLDVSETQQQTSLLREVGARLSDVFGADDILWVEGATEEECFPILLSEVANRPLRGTKILGVLNTGDFEGKRRPDAFRIYRRLSEAAGGLMPVPVGYVFDREGRTEQDCEDLRRESKGLVSFLPRKMYENYLVNPCAIAETINAEMAEGNEGVSPKAVEEWLDKHRWDKKYFGDGQVDEPFRTDEIWLQNVDGAKLLKDMFQDLSGTLVYYRKVEHGRKITRWLCDHDRMDLEGLAAFLKEKLEQGSALYATE